MPTNAPADLLQELATEQITLPAATPGPASTGRLWMPRRVVFTPAALAEAHGQAIRERVEALGLPVEILPANRLTGLRGADERETYRLGKSTLAVVIAPPGAFRLQPIPPSADWQFHLAEGCPAHCQYCYLAGSLSGPPVVRVFANLPAILDNLANYVRADRPETSFEVSCYTDPLGIEHLTGSLAACIRWFGARPGGDGARLRWVSKFDAVEPLLGLSHGGRTRCRASVNALPVSRKLEGGTSPVPARLAALGRLAREGGYPVGLVIAPIMPIEDWEAHYGALLDQAATALATQADRAISNTGNFAQYGRRTQAQVRASLDSSRPGAEAENEAVRSARDADQGQVRPSNAKDGNNTRGFNLPETFGQGLNALSREVDKGGKWDVERATGFLKDFVKKAMAADPEPSASGNQGSFNSLKKNTDTDQAAPSGGTTGNGMDSVKEQIEVSKRGNTVLEAIHTTLKEGLPGKNIPLANAPSNTGL